MPNLAKPTGVLYGDHVKHVVTETLTAVKSNSVVSGKMRHWFDHDLHELCRLAALWHDQGKTHARWQDACKKDFDVFRHAFEQGTKKSGVSLRDTGFRHEIGSLDRYVRQKSKGLVGRLPQDQALVALAIAGHHNKISKSAMSRWCELELSYDRKNGHIDRNGKLYSRQYVDPEKNTPFAVYFLDGIGGIPLKGIEEFLEIFYGIPNGSFDARHGVMLNAARSLLQYGDKRASAQETEKTSERRRVLQSILDRHDNHQRVEDYYYPTVSHNGKLGKLKGLPPIYRFEIDEDVRQSKYPSPRALQQRIRDEAGPGLTMLRSPTGAGKTYAAMLWAERMVKAGKANRLVTLMPTRFTSNELYKGMDELTKTGAGIHHSTSWLNYMDTLGKYYDGGIRFKEDGISHATPETKLLLHDYRDKSRTYLHATNISTVDQAILAMTGSKEHRRLAMTSLADSCVVVDEVDFYDKHLMQNLLYLLELLDQLDVPVLLMSATLSDAFMMRVGDYYAHPVLIDDRTKDDVPKCVLQQCRADGIDGMYEAIKSWDGASPLIVYANTVDRANQYAELVKQHAKPDTPIVVYHSRFTEKDKKETKEPRIIGMLGRDAWANGTAHGVVIMTQIGEMSINISADLMITDACPVDRLVQRIGRLCRFEEGRVGNLVLVEPWDNDKDKRYYLPYGNPREKDCPMVDYTIDEVPEGLHTYGSLLEAVNGFYDGLTWHKPNENKLLQEMIKNATADITSYRAMGKEDDDHGNEHETFKVREIAPSITLMTPDGYAVVCRNSEEYSSSSSADGKLYCQSIIMMQCDALHTVRVFQYQATKLYEAGFINCVEIHEICPYTGRPSGNVNNVWYVTDAVVNGLRLVYDSVQGLHTTSATTVL